MNFKLALAISLSIVFILAASWFRFGTASYTNPELAANSGLFIPDSDYYEEEAFLKDFLEPRAENTETTAEPLSSTDVVGRNLILDYVNLATVNGGAVSTRDIDTLAQKQVLGITNFHQFEEVEVGDINIVTDSEVNARTYAYELLQIYGTYAERMGEVSNKPSISSGDIASATEQAIKIYKEIAELFKKLPVPSSVSEKHLTLTNNYFSNAAAMQAMQDLDKDPTAAVAALIVLKENIGVEVKTLGEIKEILNNKWGII